MGLKFYFYQWKTYFSWFIVKLLKLVVISHSLCYIWNVNSLVLCKLPILFSIVKFKLGYNFPNSSIDAKFGFLSRLYFQVVSNLQKDFGIFKYYSSWTSQFFPVHDKDGKLGFLKTSLCFASKFFQIHKRAGKLGFLKFLLYPPPIHEAFLL